MFFSTPWINYSSYAGFYKWCAFLNAYSPSRNEAYAAGLEFPWDSVFQICCSPWAWPGFCTVPRSASAEGKLSSGHGEFSAEAVRRSREDTFGWACLVVSYCQTERGYRNKFRCHYHCCKYRTFLSFFNSLDFDRGASNFRLKRVSSMRHADCKSCRCDENLTLDPKKNRLLEAITESFSS